MSNMNIKFLFNLKVNELVEFFGNLIKKILCEIIFYLTSEIKNLLYKI